MSRQRRRAWLRIFAVRCACHVALRLGGHAHAMEGLYHALIVRLGRPPLGFGRSHHPWHFIASRMYAPSQRNTIGPPVHTESAGDVSLM